MAPLNLQVRHASDEWLAQWELDRVLRRHAQVTRPDRSRFGRHQSDVTQCLRGTRLTCKDRSATPVLAEPGFPLKTGHRGAAGPERSMRNRRERCDPQGALRQDELGPASGRGVRSPVPLLRWRAVDPTIGEPFVMGIDCRPSTNSADERRMRSSLYVAAHS